MGRRIIAQFALGAAVAALLVAGQVTAAGAATIAERSCDDALPATAVCGTLTVPENRADAGGRQIDVPYTVLPAANPTGSPIVTMAGGPGQDGLDTALALAEDERIGGTRDVVLLGQRGGLDSSAPLDCPAASSAYVDTFTNDGSPIDEMSEVGLALKTCIDAFAAEGGDISAYTATDTAADVIELRQALGYPVWTLYGDTWSTKVMQLAEARDPQGVDALVLDAFTPLGRDIKGDAYFALSDTLNALSARSDGAYPDLNGDLAEAAALFSDEPVNGLMTNPITGRQRYYSLTGSDVVTIVQQALYDPTTAPEVPYLLSRLAAGETGAINPFIPGALDQIARTSLAQYWISLCRDEQPFWSADPVLPAAEGEDPAETTPLPVLTYLTAADAICGSTGLAASPGETRVGGSPQGQPTLIVASDTDPLVPVVVAQSGQASFPSSQLVTIQSGGRGGITADACAMDQLATWLAAPGTAVEPICSDQATTYPILSPDSVHPSSRADSVVKAVEQRNWFELTIPLIFGGFALLWLVGWLIAVIVQVARRERFGVLIASGIAPVTAAVFLAACWLTVSSALAAYPGFTLVGVPTITPWLGILLGVGFFGIIPVWRLGSRGTAALAAAATLVWLAMIVWFVWIAVLPS